MNILVIAALSEEVFRFVVVLIRVRVLVSQFDSGKWILVVLTNEKVIVYVWVLFGGFENFFCVVCQCVLRFAKLGGL
jgi:hypothetical protein